MKRFWPVLLATLVAFGLLCGLGTWQLQRLQWKQDLIAAVELQATQEPVDLTPEVVNRPAVDPAPEYLKIKTNGRFLAVPALRMMASANGGAGWRLIQPFKTQAGITVLVERGVAPASAATASPEGEMELIGVVRHHAAGQGRFDPENDVSGNRWYWWDLAAMQRTLPDGVSAGFILQLLPGTPGTEGLIVETPKAALTNNHLGYAITWFGLALALLAVAGFYVRGQMKKTIA